MKFINRKTSIAFAAIVLMGAGGVNAQGPSADPVIVKGELQQLLSDINTALAHTNVSIDDLTRARDSLLTARSILQNGNGATGGGLMKPSRPTGPGSFRPALTCVSRDNDGNEPYIMAARGADLIDVKIAGTVAKKSDCEQAIAGARPIGKNLLVCASRDNDGQSPYALVTVDLETKKSSRIGVYGSTYDCFSSVQTALFSRTHISICVSRDGDGQSPWVRKIMALADGTTQVNPTTYNNLQECETAP